MVEGMNMVIVVVIVDEPADGISPAESIVTGVFHGFKDEEEAEKWLENMRKEWEYKSNTRWIIMDSHHFSTSI
jgi:hypothetical protein